MDFVGSEIEVALVGIRWDGMKVALARFLREMNEGGICWMGS